MSQKDFSNLIKINKSFLSKVEGGKSNVSLRYLIKIAKGLRIPLGYLFKIKTKPEIIIQ